MEYIKRSSSRIRGNNSWSSIAFIVESILLLVFLTGSLALLTMLFSASMNRSVESRTLDAAVIGATSIAEHFAADPTGVAEQTQLGDLIVKCDVTGEPREDGTLYRAQIDVYSAEDAALVYSLSTSRYEGGES